MLSFAGSACKLPKAREWFSSGYGRQTLVQVSGLY
ncbi:hypothetical protein M2422_004474 [Enterobacter sp. SLBN-59]|nr:hypothetical protein [Enterobacter sp. SLBN-59]